MNPNFLKVLLFFFVSLSLSASETKIDSIQSPELWLNQQNDIAQHLLENSQEFDKAVSAFKRAYDFAQAQNLSNHFTEIAVGYGIAMYRNGDIRNAYTILKEVLPNIGDQDLKLKAEVNQILGMTLVFRDKFPEGYKHQMDALKYYSNIKDSTGLMSVYYDLGTNFGIQGQSEMALENYNKGIALAKSANDTKMTILGITAIGGAYASMNDFDKALRYSSESIELAKLLKDNEELAWASINHGHILGQLKKYEEATYFLTQAYDLSFEIGNKLLTAYALEQMADIYFQQDKLTEAISGLDESLEVFQELGQINSTTGIVKKYAEIYFKQKEFSKYKEYTDKYIMLKDSLFSTEMMESMANLKQDFEVYQLERENQIAILTKDQELTATKNYATCAITFGTLIIFLLLLILMHHKNKSAKEKNAILSAKNAEILRQNEFLANSNRDLEKFAYIISHDLKEPLRNINGFTKLLNRRVKKYAADESIEEYANFITNSTDQMTELLVGLLEYSKVSVNKSNKETTDLASVVNMVVNTQRTQLKEKECSLEVGILPNLNCRSAQMNQVFQNIISNAIKFGPSKGNNITIGAEDMGKEYRFFVKDEGIGIDPEFHKDIFVIFKRLHDRGSYTGSGIGLATCKKIIEEHGGEIWVESQNGEGACFYFTIPKCSQGSDIRKQILINKKVEMEVV